MAPRASGMIRKVRETRPFEGFRYLNDKQPLYNLHSPEHYNLQPYHELDYLPHTL